jgi:hypothetical protein
MGYVPSPPPRDPAKLPASDSDFGSMFEKEVFMKVWRWLFPQSEPIANRDFTNIEAPLGLWKDDG